MALWLILPVMCEEARRRGLALYQRQQMGAAVVHFEEAVQLNPTAVNHAYLGNALYRTGETEKATAQFERAIELDPRSAFHSNLATLLLRQGHYEKALQHFDRARQQDPEDGTLAKNYDAADMLWRVQRFEPAFVDEFAANYTEKGEITLRLAVEQRPEHLPEVLRRLRPHRDLAVIAHVLANLLLEAGHLQEAADVLRSSLQPSDFKEEIGGDPKELRIATVASTPRPELRRLIASARRLGYDIKILGLNEPWRGLGSKIELVQEYAATLDANDILMFVDAYDVLFLEPATHLKDRVGHATRVIFGAETNPAPDAAVSLIAPPAATRFRFLNSGTYIGRVSAVRSMLRSIVADIDRNHGTLDRYRLDDQRWFNRFWLAHPDRVLLDSQCHYFQTLHDVDVEAVYFDEESTLVSAAVAPPSTPCAIHGNGNGIATFHNLTAQLAARGWPDDSPLRATLGDV